MAREEPLDPGHLVERRLADGHQVLLVVADEEGLEPGGHRGPGASDDHGRQP